MKGWDIFRHSVRQVFWNLGGALRVSGVLYLVQIGLTLTLLGTVSVGDGGIGSAQASHQMSGAIVAPVVIVTLLIGLWIAVGWHRYVLLIEEPGFVPRLHMDRVLGYFGKGILIGLVMIIPAIVAGFLIGLALAAIASAAFKGQVLTIDTIIPLSLQIELSVVALIIAVPVLAIGLRLSTILPGVALKAGQPLFQGWAATSHEMGAFVMLAVLSVAGIFLLGLPDMLWGSPVHSMSLSAAPLMIYQVVSQWVQVMVGVSILTTLYGHYIEKRPLV